MRGIFFEGWFWLTIALLIALHLRDYLTLTTGLASIGAAFILAVLAVILGKAANRLEGENE